MKATIATAKRGLFEIRDEWLTRPLDGDHIEVLRGVLIEGGELPPLSVVVIESGALAVVDGNHRFAAHAAEGRAVIPYRVVGRGEATILWWLAAANRDHGKNRTAEEKRVAVARALEAPEGADMSNTDLARHCGVSVDLVRSVRAEVRGATSAAAERRQVLEGERDAESSAGVPERTAKRARQRERDGAKRGSPTIGPEDAPPALLDPEVPSHPEPPITDEAPLPFEPEWMPLAAACDRIANAVVALKRACSADLKIVPGAQEIVDCLTRAHGIATRRKPTACPAPHGGGTCPVCDGRGYTLGAVEGWEGVVAAHAARRAHA